MFRGWITKKEHITGTEQMKEKLTDAVFGGYEITVDSREQWDYMVYRSDKTIQPKDEVESERINKARLAEALKYIPADAADKEATRRRMQEIEENWERQRKYLAWVREQEENSK